MTIRVSFVTGFAILLACVAGAAAAGSDPEVRLPQGRLEGRALPDGGTVFKGIRYAAPPVGELRWKPPVPPRAVRGVQDAGRFGPSCMQADAGWNAQEASNTSEDCLYLNIWRPRAAPHGSPAPVMVYIHGGSNLAGGAAADHFDGASLAAHGVIVVTLNYRLDVFGFLALPQLTAESPHHASSNYGLLDQIAALGWVRAHIASFGGDPHRVTLFGQSSGAVDVGFLLASPLARGYFQGAILESGSPVRRTTPLRIAEQAGVQLAGELHAPSDGAAALAFLRALPARRLQDFVAAKRGKDNPAISVVDGWVLPAPPNEILAAGGDARVPLILGTNAREIPGPPADQLVGFVRGAFGSRADAALAFYGLGEGGSGNRDPLYGSAAEQASADVRHRCVALQQALWHTAAGSAVYEYQFDPPIPDEPAPRHSTELPFVFGNFLDHGPVKGLATPADRTVSEQVQRYWTQFARTGDPNGGTLPHWPRFDAVDRGYLEFTSAGPVQGSRLRAQICDLYSADLLATLPAAQSGPVERGR